MVLLQVTELANVSCVTETVVVVALSSVLLPAEVVVAFLAHALRVELFLGVRAVSNLLAAYLRGLLLASHITDSRCFRAAGFKIVDVRRFFLFFLYATVIHKRFTRTTVISIVLHFCSNLRLVFF